ncbi:MAG: caspase family protein, partial [Microcystis aeruginosa]
MAKNWVIAIGINEYDNLKPLKYAKKDAEAIKAWCEGEGGFDRSGIFLFTEDSPPIPASPPIPTQLTHGRLKRFLQKQFETPLLKSGDNLWFFFAGHGRRYQDKDYLMLPDSDPGNVRETAVSVDYVTERLRRSGADNVVLLLDACRDEDSRGGLGIGEEEHQGVITFYSCTANQQSWEIDELQQGSFTHTLLEGLRRQGEANCATVERLDEHLRRQVEQTNARYGKPRQNPYLKAEPPHKLYFILLEQVATLRDVQPLKYQASLAENRGDLDLAEQLWIRVLGASRGDLDAIEAIKRIALRQSQWSPIPVTGREYVTGSEGNRSSTPKPSQETGLKVFNRDKLSLVDLLEDSITEDHRKTRDDQNRKYLEWLNSLPEDKKLATQKMNTIFQLTQRSLRVSDLKKMLAKASLYQGNTENEEFDRELTKAIEEFQNKYGLSPDGTCG